MYENTSYKTLRKFTLMRLKYNILLVINLFFSFVVTGQVDNFDKMKNKNSQNFEEFKKTQTTRFENYKKEKQLEFAAFLEKKWKEFNLFAGSELPELPEPVDPPVAEPTDTLPNQEIPALPVVVSLPEEKPIPLPDVPVIPDNVVYNKVNVEFLGHKLTINYDKTFNLALPQITEDKIAAYWKQMAQGSFDEFIYQCFLIKNELQLNDWGYYLFVKTLADTIYPPERKNEKIALTAFILDNSGYKVRMGRDADYKSLLLLLAIQEHVYQKSYFVFSDEKYYLVEGEIEASMYTYNEWKEDNKKNGMSLILKKPLKASNSYQTKTIVTRALDGEIEIIYNPQLKEFYNQMPTCDVAVSFNSECSEELAHSLKTSIGKRLEGKSKLEQVATLLSFIHEGFPYMTDGNQFGHEKFFFYEESFIYPYSDCEDNSILFAHLVRKLTGLKVIGLLYHDHVATAVQLDQYTDGAYVLYKGEKYTICDPTYVGARIGQSMPQYLDEPAQIIEIQNI
jgi:hypothetical protein